MEVWLSGRTLPTQGPAFNISSIAKQNNNKKKNPNFHVKLLNVLKTDLPILAGQAEIKSERAEFPILALHWLLAATLGSSFASLSLKVPVPKMESNSNYFNS